MGVRSRHRRGPVVVLTVSLSRPRLLLAAAALIAAVGLLTWLAQAGSRPGLPPGSDRLGPSDPGPHHGAAGLPAPPGAGSPVTVPPPPRIPDQCDPPGWPDPSLYGVFTEEEAPWAGRSRPELDQARQAAGASRWLAGFRVTAPEPLFEERENLRRGAELLAGTVVEAGTTFSMNAAIGPYTKARGYRLGPSYLGGRLVPSEGGGVCKVSTALYNAVIHSGLTVVERHPHSMIVPYVAPGRDAAVSYGGKDFRFRNDAGAPVVVWAELRDLTLFVGLYGSHEPPAVTWHHQVLARQEPWTLRPYNPDLGPGQERVVHEGFPGLTVRTWLTIEYPGKEPEQRDLGIDAYQPLPRIVERGP